LKAPEIIGLADVENLVSIHVLEKLGLEKRSVFDYDGEPHHWMSIKNEVKQIPN